MKRKLLFVDDEENILEGLKRLFRPMREEWDMFFLPGAEEALKLMETEPIDIIVTDMRMPKMDGLQLLTTVKERYPETIRFILSGHSDRELLIKSASLAHSISRSLATRRSFGRRSTMLSSCGRC
jgi:YesN/AraC family two-component response regulator